MHRTSGPGQIPYDFIVAHSGVEYSVALVVPVMCSIW